LLNQSNVTRSPGFCLPPGVAAIHTQDETQFINPSKVGKRFKVTWEIVEEYDKRGRHYQVIDTVVVDEDGTEILRRRAHVTYFQGKGGEQ
jgi:acyl dehydratase